MALNYCFGVTGHTAEDNCCIESCHYQSFLGNSYPAFYLNLLFKREENLNFLLKHSSSFFLNHILVHFTPNFGQSKGIGVAYITINLPNSKLLIKEMENTSSV